MTDVALAVSARNLLLLFMIIAATAPAKYLLPEEEIAKIRSMLITLVSRGGNRPKKERGKFLEIDMTNFEP